VTRRPMEAARIIDGLAGAAYPLVEYIEDLERRVEWFERSWNASTFQAWSSADEAWHDWRPRRGAMASLRYVHSKTISGSLYNLFLTKDGTWVKELDASDAGL